MMADWEPETRFFRKTWFLKIRLDRIAGAVGVNLAFTQDDFQDYFFDEGGLLAARRLFGEELPGLLDELNEVLVV
jgi:hypothetical protein